MSDAHPVPPGQDQPVQKPARRRRRVVALSVQDERRVAAGLPTVEQAEQKQREQTDALTLATGSGTANDARLLADVPPHWG